MAAARDRAVCLSPVHSCWIVVATLLTDLDFHNPAPLLQVFLFRSFPILPTSLTQAPGVSAPSSGSIPEGVVSHVP